jgi:uncharacterized protein YceK
VKTASQIAQDMLLWAVIAVIVLLLLTGCAELRTLTMTKEERQLYEVEVSLCQDPTAVCIRP